MNNRRVVITGLGVISALGHNVAEFWQALSHGRSGIAPIESVDRMQLRFQHGAEVRHFRAEDHFERKQRSLLDRFAQLGLVAAREAIADSGIVWTPEVQSRTGVVTGAGMGGQSTQDKEYLDLYGPKRTRTNPLTVPRAMPSAAASHISMAYGLTGPAFTITTACSSSNHAIGQAFWMVRNGLIDVAITGGSEAPFCLGYLKAWGALRIAAPDTCRPFCKSRNGMILGEGGGMLVLETLAHAQARGAPIYGEIVGLGMSADAYHIVKPSPQGPAQAIHAALRDGGLHPDQIGYINAHGTGTQANDPMETQAIRAVFGMHAERLAVSSTKSMHGHALGAAGALESVATLLALHHGVLPPTANFVEPDPACDLDVIPNEARAAEVPYALSNSFAFGGLNAVLAFRKWITP